MVSFIPLIPAVDPGPDGSGGSVVGFILLVSLYLNAVPCVLTALALWRTARWRGIVRPWLALIPIADLWVLGSLSDRYHKNGRGRKENMRRNLPVMGAVALGSLFLSGLLEIWSAFGAILSLFLGLIVWTVFLVMRLVALCRLYEGCAPKAPGLYIALSIVFPLLIPLFIFKCRW